jgi:hypothetical protein
MDVRVWGSAIAMGALCGIVAAHFLLSFLASLFLWAVGGITIGHFAELSTSAIVKIGALYGFSLSVSFLFFSFGASFDKFFSLILLTLALSVVGMIGGIIAVAVGSFLKPYWILEPMKKYF